VIFTQTIKSRGGFTLIETIIAVLLLEVGLLGMMALHVSVIKGNKYSESLTSAVILAEETVEELRADGFIALTDGTFTDSNNPLDATGEACPPSNVCNFQRAWSIADSNGSTDMKQVTVTITWGECGKNPDDSIIPCQYQLSALLSRLI
jgi:type II secretory pathway pseudopilin PulG